MDMHNNTKDMWAVGNFRNIMIMYYLLIKYKKIADNHATLEM